MLLEHAGDGTREGVEEDAVKIVDRIVTIPAVAFPEYALVGAVIARVNGLIRRE